MLTRPNRPFVNAASTFLAGLLLAAAMPARAQVVQLPDARWQAWLGCWTQADPQRVLGAVAQSHAVCVIPTSSFSAVDIATVENGKVVNRQRVDTDNARHASTRDGCTGWESAEWSSSRLRLFVRSEFTCSGGLTARSSGVFAINGRGEWLDVQGISSGGNKGVRALRYGEVSETRALPAEIVDALRGRATAASAARVSVAASLTLADIVEASHKLDAGVVEAWLVEFNAGAEIKAGALSAKHLVALADEGVAPNVIDVIVALAYPQVFAVNPATHEGEFRVAESDARSSAMSRGIGSFPIVGYDVYGFPVYGSEYFMRNGCSAYGFSPYSSSSFGCSPYCLGYYSLSSIGCSRYSGYYGYNGYGYGYGYGYNGYGYNGYGPGYGWYPGSQPVVVVVRGPQPTDAERPHGRVEKGRGYTQGGSTTSSTPKSSTTSSGSTSTGSSSSSSTGGSSGASSSGGSSAPRTAVPKKP